MADPVAVMSSHVRFGTMWSCTPNSVGVLRSGSHQAGLSDSGRPAHTQAAAVYRLEMLEDDGAGHAATADAAPTVGTAALPAAASGSPDGPASDVRPAVGSTCCSSAASCRINGCSAVCCAASSTVFRRAFAIGSWDGEPFTGDRSCTCCAAAGAEAAARALPSPVLNNCPARTLPSPSP